MTSLSESKSLTVIPPRSPPKIHFDFRPIKIRIYRNGSKDDHGTVITVTRREFKHWVIFLDAITKKLKTTTAVHKLYNLEGTKIDHFDELEPNGDYVAVERGHFIHMEYAKKHERREDTVNIKEIYEQFKTWSIKLKREEEPPIFLNSAEAIDIYLKHEGYGTITGLPYPLDCIMSRSPSTSALHMKSHMHKFGGSMEKLNKVGQHIWEEQDHEKKTAEVEKPCEVLHLPKLVGLNSSNTSTQREAEPKEEKTSEEKETQEKQQEKVEIDDDLMKAIEKEEENIKKQEDNSVNRQEGSKDESKSERVEPMKEPISSTKVPKTERERLPIIQITKELSSRVEKREREIVKLPPIKGAESGRVAPVKAKEVKEVTADTKPMVPTSTYTRPPWRNSLPYAQTTTEIFQDMVRSGRKAKTSSRPKDWDFEPTWQSGRNYAAALFKPRPREVVRSTYKAYHQVERFVDNFDPDFN